MRYPFVVLQMDFDGTFENDIFEEVSGKIAMRGSDRRAQQRVKLWVDERSERLKPRTTDLVA